MTISQINFGGKGVTENYLRTPDQCNGRLTWARLVFSVSITQIRTDFVLAPAPTLNMCPAFNVFDWAFQTDRTLTQWDHAWREVEREFHRGLPLLPWFHFFVAAPGDWNATMFFENGDV